MLTRTILTNAASIAADSIPSLCCEALESRHPGSSCTNGYMEAGCDFPEYVCDLELPAVTAPDAINSPT